jgi:BA14K-like protein
MGGGAPAAHFGGGWHGGGGGWHGGYRHGGGFIPGAVAGALIGGAIASQSYGYYGGPGYYDDPGSYYDDQYYDDGAVAVAPVGDDAVTYCMQTYRSYDPASGTYQGFDGLRHPCP